MTLILSLGVAVIFGAGSYLMLKRDLIRLIIGMALVGNAANLFIMAAGLTTGEAPIYPLGDDMADPLVQAMTLTAVVISFAVTALVLGLAYRVYDAHQSVDIDRLAQAEERQAEQDDLTGQPDPQELGTPSADTDADHEELVR